jgi:hypothetical protein
MRDWRIANPTADLEYQDRNRMKIREDNARWRKNNPGKRNAKEAKRRASKLHATPNWADLSQIQKIYDNCPKGFHVDHIVPLKGRIVSGLHVPWNLQHLSAEENHKKSNKFEALIGV